MKAILSLFTLAVVFLVISPGSALASTLSLSPSSGTFNRGCTVPVQVLVDTQGANTSGADINLFYDPTRFSVTTNSVVKGNAYPDVVGTAVDSTQFKEISFTAVVDPGQTFTGTGTVATINFKVLENAPTGATQLTFDFDPNDKAKTVDSNVIEQQGSSQPVDTLSSVVNGQYTIGTGSCTSVPAQGQPVGTNSGVLVSPSPVVVPSTLPAGGLEGPTLIIAIAGAVFTIIGIAGLALL